MKMHLFATVVPSYLIKNPVKNKQSPTTLTHVQLIAIKAIPGVAGMVKTLTLVGNHPAKARGQHRIPDCYLLGWIEAIAMLSCIHQSLLKP